MMLEQQTKKLSEKELDLFVNARNIRQLKYLGVRLVDEECEYNSKKVVNYAVRKGYTSRLGFLAELSLIAAKKFGLTGRAERLEQLVSLLYQHRNGEYVFLFPYCDDEFDRIIKDICRDRSTCELHQKWHVYSSLSVTEMEKYLELYLIDLRQGNLVRGGLSTAGTKK